MKKFKVGDIIKAPSGIKYKIYSMNDFSVSIISLHDNKMWHDQTFELQNCELVSNNK